LITAVNREPKQTDDQISQSITTGKNDMTISHETYVEIGKIGTSNAGSNLITVFDLLEPKE